MALVLFDGFESLPQVRSEISLTGTTGTPQVGRDGVGKAYLGSGASAAVQYPVNDLAVCIVGFGMKPLAGAFTDGFNLWTAKGDAGSTSHIGFRLAADGKVRAYRGSTLLATSTVVVSQDVWHYFEVKCTIADSGGIFIIKVDGVEAINYTGDTKNAGTLSAVSSIAIQSRSSSANAAWIDDVYILDGTGSAPYNDFIGERVVKAARPVGNGSLSQFVGSDADSVDNYLLVDDDPFSTSDYVASATSGATDLYDMSAVSGLASVDAVQVIAYAAKSDSGAKSIRTVSKRATSTTESSDIPLSTTYQALGGGVMTAKPNGGAWTQSDVNLAEFGVKVV